MPFITYRIDLDSGSVDRQGDAQEAAPTKPKWIEAQLEAAAALAPGALGCEGLLPLRLDGGSTEFTPDQAYVDGLGRAHIVEMKKVPVGGKELMQLLAYGEHFRSLPSSVLAYWSSLKRTTPLDILRNWAGLGSQTQVAAKEEARSLPSTGTAFPPRLLLVAPSFSEDVVKLVRLLKERFVSIELWRVVELSFRDGGVVLTTEEVEPQPLTEDLWQAAGRLLKSDEFRNSFDVLGFADHYSTRGFAVSMKSAPAVRVHLYVPEGKAEVETFVGLPEHYRHPVTFEQPSDGERRKLNARFKDFQKPVPRNLDDARELGDRLAREMEEIFG